MRVILAVVFCINAAAFVWIRMVPSSDNGISRGILTGPIAQEPTGKSIGQLTMQVEAGRGYLQKYDANRRAITVMSFILGLNMAFALFVAVLRDMLKDRLAKRATERTHALDPVDE